MLKDELCVLVAETLGRAPAQIRTASSLRNDLGVDSLDVLRLVTVIENKYGIEVDEDRLHLLDTLDSAYRYVASLIRPA